MHIPTLDVLRARDPECVGTYERHSVWALVAVTLLDRLVTVPHWHLEANPLTEALGPVAWLGFTGVALTVLLGVWYLTEAWRVPIAHWVVAGMTLFTGIIVTANVAVLLS